MSRYDGAKITSSGLEYVITEEGSGAKATPGQTVSVHYGYFRSMVSLMRAMIAVSLMTFH